MLDKEINCQTGKLESIGESKKMSRMVNFMVDSLDKVEVPIKLSNYLKRYLKKEIDCIQKELEHILPDSRISELKKSSFIKKFTILYNGENKGKKFKDDLKDSLYFIYLVRNNIFHGGKTIFNMMESGQRRRLEIYTSLLLSTTEILFESISNKFNWDIKEANFRLHSNANHINNSFSKKFNVSIPEGVLFYPCCGDDTDEPISLFLNSISEFHFVDSRIIPTLPYLDCQMNNNLQPFSEEHVTIRRKHKNISENIINEVIEHEAVQNKVDENILETLFRLNIKPTDHRNETKIYKQTWVRSENSQDNIDIIRCVQDGLVAFMSIPKISVFFYRGDSHGEGGSGQWWLGPKIFNLVLDKLVDGGIIITDGSNPDPNFLDVDWKVLWQNLHKSSKADSIIKPEDFSYYDRNFICLGQCGKKYGPVYAWKVNKMK